MAVNAQFFSAAFFYISFLKDANTSHNTAATIQPNPFWFWEKYLYIIAVYFFKYKVFNKKKKNYRFMNRMVTL